MDIPQEILNKTMIREDYLVWINNEASIYVYLDLTNMFHWQDELKWKFSIKDLIEQLLSYTNVKEVKAYYGLNLRDKENSKAFHDRIRKTGAILKTKPLKFITKKIEEGLFFQRRTLVSFRENMKEKIQILVKELNNAGVVIDEPKCNFDVEMTIDMLDDSEKMSALLLFSGDSDMYEPLSRIKIQGKKIGVCGVRNNVARELHQIKDKYFDFGKLYTGKKTYPLKSENPAEAGPHN